MGYAHAQGGRQHAIVYGGMKGLILTVWCPPHLLVKGDTGLRGRLQQPLAPVCAQVPDPALPVLCAHASHRVYLSSAPALDASHERRSSMGMAWEQACKGEQLHLPC